MLIKNLHINYSSPHKRRGTVRAKLEVQLFASVCVPVAQLCPTLLRPHGLQPVRLLCPWDFPSKNTGVGCHILLQGTFLIQGSNLPLLCLLLWQLDSLPQGCPCLCMHHHLIYHCSFRCQGALIWTVKSNKKCLCLWPQRKWSTLLLLKRVD